MAEAHDPVSALDGFANPTFSVVGRADLVELAHDLGRGAAVERSLEGADRAADRACQVRSGRDDDAAGERGSVQSVLRADDEIGVESARVRRIWVDSGQLLQEAARQRELLVRRDGLEALAEAMECGQRRRGERGEFPGLVDCGRPVRPAPRAPHGDGCAQRVHRVRVPGQFAEGAHDGVRNRGGNELRGLAPLTGPEQLCDAAVGALLDELSDRIAAIEQPAVRAVHVTHGCLGGDHSLEAR